MDRIGGVRGCLLLVILTLAPVVSLLLVGVGAIAAVQMF
jgi:hypothetical protein